MLNIIIIIARKELRSLFAAPSTWLILAALQFIFTLLFLSRMNAYLQVQAQLTQLSSPPGATLIVAAPMFETLALILLMLIPIFTMRLIAEERRYQTLILLKSAPISSAEIVLGKFIGLLTFLSLIIIACSTLVMTLALGTPVDYGLLLLNVLGLLLLAASYTALGLYFSALAAQPAVAAISTVAVLFALGLLTGISPDSSIAFDVISPTRHFRSFNNGLFNSTDLIFFLLFTITFVLLTWHKLKNE
jgi:ABC-2 type transport system permease protein